jgi:hypothetical protein
VLSGLVDAGFVDTTRLEALIGKIKRKQSST